MIISILTIVTVLFVLPACTTAEENGTDNDGDVATWETQIENLNEEIEQLRSQVSEKDEEIAVLNEQLQANANSDEEETRGEETVLDEEHLRERADDVVIALEYKNFESLANVVHPEKGVRFSPYAHIDTEQHLTFEAEEVMEFGNDEEKYTWGVQDGSGHEINLTPSEYYEQYIYIRDFSREASVININEIEAHGNLLINVEEVYPDADFVSYYVTPGEDELDWANLILAFEEFDGDWYLVGLAVDRWTI